MVESPVSLSEDEHPSENEPASKIANISLTSAVNVVLNTAKLLEL